MDQNSTNQNVIFQLSVAYLGPLATFSSHLEGLIPLTPVATHMPGPCIGKNLISNLVTDYIRKRRDQELLFSFEYNLLPNLVSNFNHYMDQATGWGSNLPKRQIYYTTS